MTCASANSCTGGVTCGSGTCDITCAGGNSCGGHRVRLERVRRRVLGDELVQRLVHLRRRRVPPVHGDLELRHALELRLEVPLTAALSRK